MECKAQQVVQGQLEAYNRRDLETFLQYYSDTIKVSDLTSANPTIEGCDALRVAYGELFRKNPSLQCQVISRVSVGCFIVDEERVTGLAARPEGLHVAVIYQVEAGRILAVWITR